MKVSIRTYFGRAKRAGEINQLGERETRPGDRHAPCFNATVTVGALFERQLTDQIIDADFHRLFHHAVNLHCPRPDRQRLRGSGDRFRRAEFIEIIVVAVDLLIGDRTIERVFLVALRRIKVGARVRYLANVGMRWALAACGAIKQAHSHRRPETCGG